MKYLISLYEFWKDEINSYSYEFKRKSIRINLASLEYSKLIDKKKINNLINIDF